MKKIGLGLALLLTACAGTTEIHGSLVKPADVDRLRVGVHNQQQVMRILGTPTTTSTLNDETWYYITETKIRKPLAKPELKDRQVFVLVFNKDGLLDRIAEKDELSAKEFEPSKETTNSQGKDIGIVDQIYWNLTSGI
tara:strand:+ start:2125 stop:2538 length:414 start_codon:yes stop_codon:yes gene_type:complete